MGMHDQMAAKAALNGRTSAEFHAAAQRKANATWVYLIVAGIVWYFTAWYWALIPGVLAALTIGQSISATMIAARIEKYEKGRA